MPPVFLFGTLASKRESCSLGWLVEAPEESLKSTLVLERTWE